MIQELLFGGSSATTLDAQSGGGDRNKALINNTDNGGIIAEATASGDTKNPTDTASNNNGNNPEQNLRCPRCDSSNTKFCYYNNYNLTQPRHFCKTCRRYWTKGGALRNVPIGGGCRKNKSSFVSKPKVYSSSADHLLKSGLINPQESSLHYPTMWPSPLEPQTSHLLAFLRSTQSPSRSPSNRPYSISSSPLQSTSQPSVVFSTTMNLVSSQPSLSGCDYPWSSFLRNKSQTLTHPQHLQVPHQEYEVAQPLGGVQQNFGIQELHPRINFSTNSNTNSYSSGGNDTNHAHMVSVSSSPTSLRPCFESARVTKTVGGGSNSGLWNIPAGGYSTWTNDHQPAATNGD